MNPKQKEICKDLKTCIEIGQASLKTIWLRSLIRRKLNTGTSDRHGVRGVPPPRWHSGETTVLWDPGRGTAEDREPRGRQAQSKVGS